MTSDFKSKPPTEISTNQIESKILKFLKNDLTADSFKCFVYIGFRLQGIKR